MRFDREILRYLCAVVMLASCLVMKGQDDIAADSLDEERVEILARIQLMTDDLKQIYVSIQMLPSAGGEKNVRPSVAKVMSDRLKVADRTMKSLDFRWTTYYQTIQPVIAEDEELLDAAATFQQLEQGVRDSLDRQISKVDLLVGFCDAETFIPSQRQPYKTMFEKAMQLSLISKLAPQLEKLKGMEAIQFTGIQERYDKAKEAVAAMPGLQQRMNAIDMDYVVLKDTSDKIQAAAFKPFIQRIKDWLLGLAAVSILIMFVNLVINKIQAVKKARDNMKKMKEMMKINGGNNFYPTI